MSQQSQHPCSSCQTTSFTQKPVYNPIDTVIDNIFYHQTSNIPAMCSISSSKGILPLTAEQREVFTILTTRAFMSVLEAPEQSLKDCPEVVDPPPFNFSSFPVFDPIDDNDTSIEECPRSNTTVSVFCSKSYSQTDMRVSAVQSMTQCVKATDTRTKIYLLL